MPALGVGTAQRDVNRVALLAGAIQSVGKARFASSYFDVAIGPDGRWLTVYAKDPSAAFKAAMQKAAPSVQLKFSDVGQSLAAATAVQNETTADFASLKAEGITLNETYIDDSTGLVYIGVIGLTSAQAVTLDQMFGASNIETVDEPASDAATLTANRIDDSSPWNGGDNVTDCNDSGSCELGCTSGFGAYIGSTDYMITAGHCFPSDGDEVYNGWWQKNGDGTYSCNSNSGCGEVGTVHEYSDGYGDADSAMITAHTASDDLIWGGVVGSPTRVTIDDYTGSTVGNYVCNEGAVTGEECDLEIVNKGGGSNNLCHNFGGGFYLCHLIEADATSSTQYGIANGPGDSGGPVVWYDAGTVYAMGTVTGEGSADETCQQNTAYLVGTEPLCGDVIYYTSISYELSEWGASLHLG